jgi:hypothetical protein
MCDIHQFCFQKKKQGFVYKHIGTEICVDRKGDSFIIACDKVKVNNSTSRFLINQIVVSKLSFQATLSGFTSKQTKKHNHFETIDDYQRHEMRQRYDVHRALSRLIAQLATRSPTRRIQGNRGKVGSAGGAEILGDKQKGVLNNIVAVRRFLLLLNAELDSRCVASIWRLDRNVSRHQNAKRFLRFSLSLCSYVT